MFSIGLHAKDKALLESIQLSLGGIGNITKHSADAFRYRVNSLKDLQVLIDHFDKFPLLTQKRADYLLFKQVVEIMDRKEHLTHKGLQKIVNLRHSINKGLSDTLLAAFPKTEPVPRPEVVDQVIKDPNWVSGFTAGEGCFSIKIIESSRYKSGVQVRLNFTITQHSRDAELLKSLVTYLGCGNFCTRGANIEAGDFFVTRFSDLQSKIIPFFNKYQIEGVKALDYADFKKASEIMKQGLHLTQEGLEQIRKIKQGMNSGRL